VIALLKKGPTCLIQKYADRDGSNSYDESRNHSPHSPIDLILFAPRQPVANEADDDVSSLPDVYAGG
jgi:hypothetical protein